MTIYDLKPAFENFLRPVVKLFFMMKMTPNMITVSTCILSISYALLLGNSPSCKLYLFGLPFFFFIRMALNAIDGMLAKEHDMCTPLGAVLNEVTDVISDSALYLAFAFHPSINLMALILVIVLAITSELAGLSALLVPAKRRFDGPMGKSDRAFLFSVMAIMLGFGIESEIIYTVFLVVINILLCLTVTNRIIKAV